MYIKAICHLQRSVLCLRNFSRNTAKTAIKSVGSIKTEIKAMSTFLSFMKTISVNKSHFTQTILLARLTAKLGLLKQKADLQNLETAKTLTNILPKIRCTKKYLTKYSLSGGIVRQDKQSSELCICTESYSDDIKSDSWIYCPILCEVEGVKMSAQELKKSVPIYFYYLTIPSRKAVRMNQSMIFQRLLILCLICLLMSLGKI